LKGESRNRRSELREALDGVYDDGNRILRLVWADRQAEDLIGELFSYWQGDRRQETGDRRQETGDRRQETGDRRQETGDKGCSKAWE
jgi:hypothetical protein